MQRIRQWIKKNFSGLIYRRQRNIACKHEMMKWVSQLEKKTVTPLSSASFDIFTYHGEDGILAFLLKKLGNVPEIFVDIGAGDCIKGNCTTLALHSGWDGIFIDKDKRQLDIGKLFYKKFYRHAKEIFFVNTEVNDRNINEIIAAAGIKGKIGLLSIDIDGNDYWIWKAIKVIEPMIVIIEAKVEFGLHNVIVPFSLHNHHSADQMYNGASVESLRLLGEKKGYKLVGSNKQGYNLFFVKQDENIPSATIEEILLEPETVKSFYPESFFNEHHFIRE